MAKIMVVDDSEILLKVLHKVLKAEGHEVLEATTGDAALNIAAKTPGIELVITDLNMPDGDGLSLSKKLHKLAGYDSVPIVMLTVDSTVDARVRAKEAGVLMHIAKPATSEKLIVAVRKILARSNETQTGM